MTRDREKNFVENSEAAGCNQALHAVNCGFVDEGSMTARLLRLLWGCHGVSRRRCVGRRFAWGDVFTVT